MPTDRIAEPLTTRTGRAPVVDLLGGPDPTPVQDALSDLLPKVPAVSDLAPEERDVLLAHERMKRRKSEAEAQAKTLGRDIAAMLPRILEIKAAHQIGVGEWEALDDGQGYEIRPFEHRQLWPKYRTDPETEKPHTAEQLIEALIEAGHGELLVTRPDKDAWPRLVRTLVADWRRRAGEVGVTDDQGRHVDAHGNLLVGDELDDPTADILALPPALRRVIEPSEVLDIRYTRVPLPDTAPAHQVESDTAQQD